MRSAELQLCTDVRASTSGSRSVRAMKQSLKEVRSAAAATGGKSLHILALLARDAVHH